LIAASGKKKTTRGIFRVLKSVSAHTYDVRSSEHVAPMITAIGVPKSDAKTAKMRVAPAVLMRCDWR
jgi:hypothetical protein